MSVAYEQELELYHYSESLCSQKARIGLAEKRLPYKSHHIMICDVNADCQNLSPEYLQVNPRGLVPTLVHKGEPVFDAHRIIKYVDEQYPTSGVRLWPSDKQREQIANFWFEEAMLKEDLPMDGNFGLAVGSISLPILVHTLRRQPLKILQARMATHPLRQNAEIFLNLHQHGVASPEAHEKVLNLLTDGMLRVERQLARSGGPWMLGDFSITDVTMMAVFHRFEDVRLDAIFAEPSLRKTADYWQRLQQRPSYREAVINWHDEENWRKTIREVFGERPSPLFAPFREKLALAA